MMLLETDKMSAPSSWELAQLLYDKNIELENKRRRSVQSRIPSDPNTWQQMRENYETIILEDHAFSEQHNVEYALWQLHYRRIEEFRAHFNAASSSSGPTTSQTAKGPTRPDRVTKIRLQFKTFLSEATGFYHDLILKIRAKYGLPIGQFSDDSESRIVLEKDEKKSLKMKKGLISCHRCLIFLGDLARYKGLYGEGDSKSRDYAAASSYYLQAASLWPFSGNPHHQLAIVATYSGDEVVAVYRYFRSLSVDSPVSTARENLIVAFEKNRKFYYQLHGNVKDSAIKESPVWSNTRGKGTNEAKLRPKEFNFDDNTSEERITSIHEMYKSFCVQFVRLNGILFTRTSLETFGEVLSFVSSLLIELLSSGQEEVLNFGTDAADNGLVIVRLVSILIFTVHNVKREAEGQSYADILQRTVLLKNAVTAIFELMGNIFKRCLQLSDPSKSYLLPGILIFLEWLGSFPDVAASTDKNDEQATVTSKFWHHCVNFLNKLLSSGFMTMDDGDETCFFNLSKYEEGETDNRLALWEDFELRGFLPLQPAQVILDFSRKHSLGGHGKKEKNSRVKRILAAGKALTNIVRRDQKTLSFDLKLKKFFIGVEPLNSEDITPTFYSVGQKSDGSLRGTLTEPKINLTITQLKSELYVEAEEEDEVIVFKPTVIQKRSDAIAKLSPPEELVTGQNDFPDDSQLYGAPSSVPEINLQQQTAFTAGPQAPVPVVNIFSQHLQPHQLITSTSLVDQQASLANGLKGWSLVGNGHVTELGKQQDVRMSHIASLSLPMQQSVNVGATGIYSQAATGIYSEAITSRTMMQPKTDTNTSAGAPVLRTRFEPVASTGVNSGIMAVKLSSAFPASPIKGPANRPVRHLGPPPGFRSVRPKQVNEPISVSNMNGENPPMDDYSWLDGYQLPSSIKGLSLNHSINKPSHSSLLHNNNVNGSDLTVSFPFPGKQVPAVQFEVENPKGQQNYMIAQSLDLHRGQMQHQQFVPLPEQYQGESSRMNHHFV